MPGPRVVPGLPGATLKHRAARSDLSDAMSNDTTIDASRDAAPSQEPPPGSVDPELEEVLKLFTVLSRAHSALHEHARRDVARHGLTLTEFAVLEALYHKGPLLLGDIRRKILASSGGITYLVDRMVERGLVERRACPDDRRARYAALTPDGVAFMDRIFPEHAGRIAKALDGLSSSDRRTAIDLLKRLGKNARSSLEGEAGG